MLIIMIEIFLNKFVLKGIIPISYSLKANSFVLVLIHLILSKDLYNYHSKNDKINSNLDFS